MSILVVFCSSCTKFDTGLTTSIELSGKRERVLGGAATHFSLAASFFTDVRVVGVVGNDFTAEHEAVMTKKGIDTSGIEHADGLSFHWTGSYEGAMSEAKTLGTDLNVFGSFEPKIPESYKDSDYLFLANIDPVLQLRVRQALPNVKMVAGDTMNYWIADHRANLEKVLARRRHPDHQRWRSSAADGRAQPCHGREEGHGNGAASLVIKHGEFGATGFFSDRSFARLDQHHAVPCTGAAHRDSGRSDWCGRFVCGWLLRLHCVAAAAYAEGLSHCPLLWRRDGFVRCGALRHGAFAGDHARGNRRALPVVPRDFAPGSRCRVNLYPRGLHVTSCDAPVAEARDLNGVYPATAAANCGRLRLRLLSLRFSRLPSSASRGWMLLYGDAVAHLGIARRIMDARYPGLAQLGGVWLPLPHLLMMPFAQRLDWWQTGLAGAWPSLAAYVVGVTGCYALARKLVPASWSFVATAFFALNPNLLYLSTTAMTEPLFLALLLWSTVVTWEAVEALAANKRATASSRMIVSGVLTMAMVFTRYDGWIIGAAIWIVLALAWWRSSAETKQRDKDGFLHHDWVAVVCGPLLWFAYNAKYEGDWLDFLRGPYSAAAIERKTSPIGAKHYRGWHNPGWALLFYTRTAQVDAAAFELGFGVMAIALAGAWMQWKDGLSRIALLLWLPLPFYVYSIAWSHVPIFIPQLYPHSYYNSRYGMELLPALWPWRCGRVRLCGAQAARAQQKGRGYLLLCSAGVLADQCAWA